MSAQQGPRFSQHGISFQQGQFRPFAHNFAHPAEATAAQRFCRIPEGVFHTSYAAYLPRQRFSQRHIDQGRNLALADKGRQTAGQFQRMAVHVRGMFLIRDQEQGDIHARGHKHDFFLKRALFPSDKQKHGVARRCQPADPAPAERIRSDKQRGNA